MGWRSAQVYVSRLLVGEGRGHGGESTSKHLRKSMSARSVFYQLQSKLPLDQRIRKSPTLNTMAPCTGGAGTKWPGVCGSSTSSPPSLSSGSWKSSVHVPKSL